MLSLPDEVWGNVISHLQRPHPVPRVARSRSDMRQPDLASCMRVSILFNKLAAPILYRRVYTDDPLSFSAGSKYMLEPAHPSIKSKLQLFSFVRHIDFEYPAWHSAENRLPLIEEKDEPADFVADLQQAMTRFNRRREGNKIGGLRHYFTSRPTISLCVLFGVDGSAWEALEEDSALEEYRYDVQRFIQNISLNHICQRYHEGPLSLMGDTLFYRSVLGPWIFVSHGARRQATPRVYGGSTWWIIPSVRDIDMDIFDHEVLDGSVYDDESEYISPDFHLMCDSVRSLTEKHASPVASWDAERQLCVPFTRLDEAKAPRQTDLTVYMDADRIPEGLLLDFADTCDTPGTIEGQVELIASYNEYQQDNFEIVKEELEEAVKGNVSITWKHRIHAPICPACGLADDFASLLHTQPSISSDTDSSPDQTSTSEDDPSSDSDSQFGGHDAP